MHSAGYTLIELLIVISIIAVLSSVGFINYNKISADQVSVKAKGQIQSLLRLAQSNASSSTLCNGQGATFWYLDFSNNNIDIYLRCDTASAVPAYSRKYSLEGGAQIESIKGSSQCGETPITSVKYAASTGAFSFSASGVSPACLSSDSLTFTIKNSKNSGTVSQSFKMSRGGAINVN